MEKRETPYGSGRVKTPRPFRFFEPSNWQRPTQLWRSNESWLRQVGKLLLSDVDSGAWLSRFPAQTKIPTQNCERDFLVLEQLNEFVRAETGLAEDLLERGIWQILAVERHDGRQALRFVPQDKMAASLSFLHEADPFERRHQVCGAHCREPGQAGIGRRT